MKRQPLTVEQQKLCEDNMALVRWAVNRWAWCRRGEFEDAVAYVTMGLVRAAQMWDPSHQSEASFGSYAAHWLKQKCYQYIAEGARRMAAVSELQADDEDASLDRADGSAPHDWSSACADLLKHCSRFVSLRQWSVLEMRYLEGLTLEEVGRRLGLTRERVRQIERRAKQRIRKAVAA